MQAFYLENVVICVERSFSIFLCGCKQPNFSTRLLKSGAKIMHKYVKANKKTVKILVLIQKLVSLRAYIPYILYMRNVLLIEITEIKTKN